MKPKAKFLLVVICTSEAIWIKRALKGKPEVLVFSVSTNRLVGPTREDWHGWEAVVTLHAALGIGAETKRILRSYVERGLTFPRLDNDL